MSATKRSARERADGSSPEPGLRPGAPDGGAATVVGALLVTSLVVVALIVFRTSAVPALEEEAEEKAMGELARALMEVRSNVDAHVGEQRPGRLSQPVTSSSSAGTPLAPDRPDDVLSFHEGSEVTVWAPSATVWERNDTLLVRDDPDWRPVTGIELGGEVTIREIEQVMDLRVRIDSVSPDDDGDQFTVRALEADGGLAGRVTYEIQDTRTGAGGPVQVQIVAEVENTDGDIVFDQPIATLTEARTWYEIDVLDPSVGFDQILTSAENPMRLVLVENGVEAERALTYSMRSADTDTRVVDPGGGREVTPLLERYAGGTLQYEALNNFFVDQTYRLEHGALLVHQDDRAAIKTGPHIPSGTVETNALGTVTKAGLGLPLLTGSQGSTAGAEAVTVTTETQRRAGLSALAPQVSFNLTTEAPQAWEAWTRNSYEDAGLPSGAFSIESGASWVNVTVEGTSPFSTEPDVHVDLDTARVATTMER